MKGYSIEPDSPVNQMIGLDITGNIVPLEWFKHLKHENGKPHSLAVLVLADIVYWYRPIEERDEATGAHVAYRKKFAGDQLQRSYSALADQYGYTKDQVRDALSCLRALDLISLDFRTVTKNGQLMNNVMYIGLNVKRLREITYPPLSDLNGIGVSGLNGTPIGFKADRPIGFKSETNTETTSTETSQETPTNTVGASAPTASAPSPNGSLVKNPGAYRALVGFEQGSRDLDLGAYPEDTRAVIGEFCRLWKLTPPAATGRKSGEYKLWIGEARELAEACAEFGLAILAKVHADLTARPLDERLTIARPGSLTRITRAKAGELRAAGEQKKAGLLTFEQFQAGIQELYEYTPTERDYQTYLANNGVRA